MAGLRRAPRVYDARQRARVPSTPPNLFRSISYRDQLRGLTSGVPACGQLQLQIGDLAGLHQFTEHLRPRLLCAAISLVGGPVRVPPAVRDESLQRETR